MIDKIKALIIRYRELIVYVIFGGLTTVVDFAVYWLLTRLASMDEVPANIIGIAAAIVFAFIVNKRYVFADKTSDFFGIVKLFVSFASMRVLSGFLQTFALWLFADVLGLYDMAVKAVVAVAVVILNYIFSKLVIFKNSKKNNQ